jgi:uncharacterized membrane protein YsdA (DUF1294 family)
MLTGTALAVCSLCLCLYRDGFMGKLPIAVVVLYFAASAATFVAYAIDKSAATRDTWRIRESTLHLLAVIGGWPGALVAQQALRHKSRKPSFRTTFWFTVLLNCAGLAWLLWRVI